MDEKVVIVIPAMNEATRIVRVIRNLKAIGYSHIVVVNDGSKDSTAELSLKEGVRVLSHVVNLGSGAATQTGLEYAITLNPTYIVTMDADGQHKAEDVDVLVEAIRNSSDSVIIGSRFLVKSGPVPYSRIIANRMANVITWLLTGKFSTDSQSGMKIIRADFAKEIQFQFQGYEFCTELFYILGNKKAKFSEVPIKAIYTHDSLGKGQNVGSGLKMLWRLFGKYG